MTQAWTREAEQQEMKLRVVDCHVTVVKITHLETSCFSPRFYLFSD